MRNILLVMLLGACALPVAKSEIKQQRFSNYSSSNHRLKAIKQQRLAAALTYGYGMDTVYVLPGDYSEGMAFTAAMIIGNDGNLYGATDNAFYKAVVTGNVVNPTVNYSVLYEFNHSGCGGKLAKDGSGYMYGTCQFGGTNNEGIVYRINTSTGAVTILHSFGGTNDGVFPLGGVIIDGSGKLYGTTYEGDGTAQYGTLWKLTPSGGGYSYSVLYRFGSGGVGDGLYLTAAPTLVNGILYGVTLHNVGFTGATFWKYNLSTSTLTNIMDVADAGYAGLTQIPTAFTSGGKLEFWSTGTGGTYNYGSIYKISETSAGSGVFTDTIMHSFNNGANEGFGPSSGNLVFATNIQNYSLDAGGALYGVVFDGGMSGEGSVFRIDLSGTYWDIPRDVGINGAQPDGMPSGIVAGTISSTPVLFIGSASGGTGGLGHLSDIYGW